MEINAAQTRAHTIAQEHGWWDTADDCNVPTKIALMHSELSEALEAFREDKIDLYFQYRDPDTKKLVKIQPDHEGELPEGVGEPKPMGFGTELADTIIRIFDLAEWMDINLDYLIQVKMRYNETRPPRHGGKKV